MYGARSAGPIGVGGRWIYLVRSGKETSEKGVCGRPSLGKGGEGSRKMRIDWDILQGEKKTEPDCNPKNFQKKEKRQNGGMERAQSTQKGGVVRF